MASLITIHFIPTFHQTQSSPACQKGPADEATFLEFSKTNHPLLTCDWQVEHTQKRDKWKIQFNFQLE